jgi:hypothetical protein
MAKVFIEESTLTAIGNAIRNKRGTTTLIDPADFAGEIQAIETGGGGGGADWGEWQTGTIIDSDNATLGNVSEKTSIEIELTSPMAIFYYAFYIPDIKTISSYSSYYVEFQAGPTFLKLIIDASYNASIYSAEEALGAGALFSSIRYRLE